MNESTRQRRRAPAPVAFMSTPAAIGPTCAPFSGSSTTSKSTSLRYDAQTQAIYAYVKGRADGKIPAGRPERAGG